jgi:prepilin-type N-terminal cleavage/methylation domain-containing protein
MTSAECASTDRGFTLVEVLIAMVVLAIVSLGVAALFGTAVRATHAARNQTSTSILAEQKLEQLRSLTWGFDTSGQNLPVSDTTTNLATNPPSDGGPGLNPSPANSLDVNTQFYVDFLDARGQWVGTGANPPGNTAFVRRWSVQPLPTNPNNTLVMQVLVTPIMRDITLGAGGTRKRYPDDALVATVKTRKAH